MNIYILFTYIHQLPIVNILPPLFQPSTPKLSLPLVDFPTLWHFSFNTSACILCLVILSAILAYPRSFLQPNEFPQLLVSYIYCFFSLEYISAIFHISKSYPSFKVQLRCPLIHEAFPSQFSFCCLCNYIPLIAFSLAPPLFTYMSHIPNNHKHLSVSNSNLYFP